MKETQAEAKSAQHRCNLTRRYISSLMETTSTVSVDTFNSMDFLSGLHADADKIGRDRSTVNLRGIFLLEAVLQEMITYVKARPIRRTLECLTRLVPPLVKTPQGVESVIYALAKQIEDMKVLDTELKLGGEEARKEIWQEVYGYTSIISSAPTGDITSYLIGASLDISLQIARTVKSGMTSLTSCISSAGTDANRIFDLLSVEFPKRIHYALSLVYLTPKNYTSPWTEQLILQD